MERLKPSVEGAHELVIKELGIRVGVCGEEEGSGGEGAWN